MVARMKFLPALLLCLTPFTGLLAAPAYDPLAVTQTALPAPLDLMVQDAARNREIPLHVWLPAEKGPEPVVIFSHGLGGTPAGYAYLGKQWAARGYVAVFLQHHGSDDGVWKNAEPGQRFAALKAGASLANFLDRVRDVPAVIDQLTKWNQESGHPLAGRMNLEEIGMSGHSFGAVTTQGVSGEQLSTSTQHFTDPRIKAALPMSPSVPKRPGELETAFKPVKIPWMLMTGTKDSSPIGDATPESRQLVFPALPAGDKYQLVLFNAEHSAFTERPLPGDQQPRNPNHHRAILALSTAFWDATLRHDAAARAWLQGDGPRSVLEPQDRFEKK
jgi:predicted dienelactone hydrolase